MKKNRILSILFFVIISIASFITVGQAIWVLLDKYVNNYKPEYYPVDIDEKLESVYDGEDIVVTLNKQESDYDINVNHLIADLTKEKVGWEYYSVSDERNDGTKTIEPMNKTPIDVGEYIVKFYYETLNDNPETDEVEWDKSIIRTVSHTITPKTITISEDLSPNDVVYGDRYETETKELSMNYYNNEIYDRDKEAFRSYLKTENDVTKFKVDVYSEYNTNDVDLRNVGDYDCYINLEHPNYIFEYTGENSLHISPRPVSFSFDKGTEVENFVYDNTTHTPNYTFGVVNGNPSSGLVYGETSQSITEVSFKIGQGENPEGYVPTDYYPEGHIVSLTLNENYKLADQSTELAKLIMITKRPVDIYWETLTTEELVYDKKNNKVTPSFVSEYEDDDEAGVILGDDLEVDTIYKLEGTKVQNQINVGNYTFEATLKGTDSHNYKVRNDTYDSDQYFANAFEVTPRPVTVNFGTNEYIKTYDATNFTPASGASFDNVVSGDTLNPVVNYFDLSIIDRKEYLSGPKDAGKYIAIITLPETETAKNYKLVVVEGVIDGNEIYVDATEDSKEVEIERKSLIVTFGITQFFKVYDKEGFDIGTTTFNGLQGGETLTPIINYYKGTGNSATAISEAPVYYNADNYEARVTMPSNEVAKNYYLASAHNGEEESHIAKTLIINRREILINYKDGQAFNKIYDKQPFEAGNDAYFSNASTNNDSKSPWVEDGLEIDVVYYNGLTKLDSAPINYSASNYAMFASAKENDLLYNYVVTNNNKEQALVINKRPVAVDWNEESIEFEYLEESTQNPSYTFAAIEGNANSGLISGDELSPSKDYFGGPTKTIYDNNEEIVLGKTANASSLNRDGEYPALLDGASAYTVKFSLDDTFKNGECANINYTISANDTSHAYYIKATPIYGALTAGDENVRQNLSSTQTYSSELEQFTHDYTYTSEPISPTGYAYKANDVNKTPLQNANLQVVVKVYDEEDNELANENHVDVGSYVAKALTLSGKSAGSYELVGTQKGTFNIKPKVLEVTWSGEAKDSFGYNYFTYNKQEKILSYNVLGVFEKDASNVSFSSANVSTALNANVDNIGNVLSSLYQTKVSMLGDKAKNYCFANPDLMENATKEKIGEFKIYPSVIEITVANKTDYIYGDSLDYSSSSTDFSFEITSGIYYESSLNDLGTPTYSSTYVGGETNAGDDVDISVAFNNFNKNYHISATNKGTLTVNKRPVVLAWADNQGLIYNGRQQIPSASISNRVYNDDVKAVVTYSETTGVNAGSHSVYVEANSGIVGNRSNNYIFDTRNTLHYVIAKYNIVFDGNNFTLTYGENPSKNTYSYSLNSNYTIHTNAITNALDTFTAAEYDDNYSRYDDIGEYTINKVSGLENVNYTVTYNPGKLTVNPKSINVSWNVGTYVYNKTPQGPSVSFVAEQIENNDELKVVATNYGTNAGSYTAGLSFTGDKAKNYSISNPTQSYSIAKASVNKPAENTSTFTYTGFEQTYSLTTNELYTITNDKRTNAGSQDVTIALKDAANYKWNGTEDDSNPFTYKFTIGKADTIISVEVTGSDNVPGISYCELYEIEVISNVDGLVNISIINGNETVVSKENLVLNNGILVIKSNTFGSHINAGSYKLVVTEVESTNYKADSEELTLEILKIDISSLIVSSIPTQAYTGLEVEPDVTLTYLGNIVSSNEYTVVYSNNINVGTNTAVITITCNNINFTGTKVINFSIEKVDINSAIIKDIPNQVYTGTPLTPTLEISYNEIELINGEDYTLTYANNTSLGIATVTIEGINNFYGTVTKTFGIRESIETATFNSIPNVTYNKTAHTPTPSVTLNDQPLTLGVDYSISYSNNINAGTATVIITGIGNYAGTASTTFTITPATPNNFGLPTIISYYEGTQANYTGGFAQDENNELIPGSWTIADTTKNTFLKGKNTYYTHPVVVTFISDDGNYYLNTTQTANLLPVATIDSTYYGTIEKALNDATSGQTVYVISGTTPTIRTNTAIKSGVTLILPYNNKNEYNGRQRGENKGNASNNNIWFDDISSSAFADSNEAYYRTLNVTIAKGITLTNNGILFIGGITGWEGQGIAGQTSGFYAQITMDEGSKIINSGEITCLGYIKNLNPSKPSLGVESTSGTVKAPFVFYDYRGGGSTVGAYAASEGNPVGPFDAKNQPGNIFPMNRFNMPNINLLTVTANAELIGFADLYTPETSMIITIPSMHNVEEIKVVGSENSLISLSSGGKVIFNNNSLTGKTEISFYGGATLKDFGLTVSIVGQTVSMTTKNVYFPISNLFDIKLYNGVYDIVNKVKLLPGSSLTVDETSTLNISASTAVYDEFYDTSTVVPNTEYPRNLPPAKLINNGVINITSSFGGHIQTQTSGAIINFSENAGTTVVTTEGDGAFADLKFSFRPIEVPDVDAKGNISGSSENPSKFVAGKIYMSNSSNIWDIVTSYDEYTISANANGGTINGYSTAEFKYILRTGQVVSLTSIPVTAPIKEHYEFTGWYTDAACTPDSKISETNPVSAQDETVINVYAGWKPETYNIDYFVTDDKGQIFTGQYNTNSTESYTFDSQLITLGTPNVIGDDSYTFYGWYLDETFQTKVELDSFTPAEFYEYTSGTNTLYGYFSAATIYTVSFDDNNDQLSAESTLQNMQVMGGSTINLSSYENVLKANDNIKEQPLFFAGWYYVNSNNEQVEFVSNETSVESDLLLFAKWDTKPYSITYKQGTDLNVSIISGYIKPQDVTYYYLKGSSANIALTPATEQGHTFSKWVDNSDNTKTYNTADINTNTFSSTSVILVATYTRNTYKLIVNDGKGQITSIKAEGTSISNGSTFTYGDTITISFDGAWSKYNRYVFGDSESNVIHSSSGRLWETVTIKPNQYVNYSSLIVKTS